MIKRNISMVSLILVLTMIFTISVCAVAPGFSDYDATPMAKIDANSPGKPVEMVSAITGVAVTLSANVLPAGVTGVALETKALDNEEKTQAISEVKDAITNANLDKESEKIVEQYTITPVSAITLNLVDQNNKAITQLEKPIGFTVPVEKGTKGANAVAYVDPKTGKLVIIEGKVKNGFMTFDTDVVGVQFVLLKLIKKK